MKLHELSGKRRSKKFEKSRKRSRIGKGGTSTRGHKGA